MKRRPTVVTLADESFDQRGGYFDMVTLHRPWWRRLLRRRPARRTILVFGNVRGSTMRMWRVSGKKTYEPDPKPIKKPKKGKK